MNNRNPITKCIVRPVRYMCWLEVQSMDGIKKRYMMLLTKYKVQELVENAKIDLDDLSQNVGAFLEDGIDDDNITLVYAAIDMLKEKIIDEVGRLS